MKRAFNLSIITLNAFLLFSCEDEPVKNQPTPIQPPIIVEPEIFPELGHDGPYEAGSVYFGREGYIEYHAGNLPIILSAPHGGQLTPDEIPDRTYGTMVTDDNTYELTKVIMDSMKVRFSGTPHVILCKLKRRKIDPTVIVLRPHREIAMQSEPGKNIIITSIQLKTKYKSSLEVDCFLIYMGMAQILMVFMT